MPNMWFACVVCLRFVPARLANVVINFELILHMQLIPNMLGVFFALICAHEACQYVQICTYTYCWDFFFC